MYALTPKDCCLTRSNIFFEYEYIYAATPSSQSNKNIYNHHHQLLFCKIQVSEVLEPGDDAITQLHADVMDGHTVHNSIRHQCKSHKTTSTCSKSAEQQLLSGFAYLGWYCTFGLALHIQAGIATSEVLKAAISCTPACQLQQLFEAEPVAAPPAAQPWPQLPAG